MKVKKYVIFNRRTEEEFGFKCYLDLVGKTSSSTIGNVLNSYIQSKHDDFILIPGEYSQFTGPYKTIVFL